jgi:hypothetical protein
MDPVGKYPICSSFRWFLAIQGSLKSNRKNSKNLEEEGRNAIWHKRERFAWWQRAQRNILIQGWDVALC